MGIRVHRGLGRERGRNGGSSGFDVAGLHELLGGNDLRRRPEGVMWRRRCARGERDEVEDALAGVEQQQRIHREHKPECGVRIVLLNEPVHCIAKVLELSVVDLEPFRLVGTGESRADLRCERSVVRRVPSASGIDVAGFGEPFGRVLTDRFEEAIALVAPDVGPR